MSEKVKISPPTMFNTIGITPDGTVGSASGRGPSATPDCDVGAGERAGRPAARGQKQICKKIKIVTPRAGEGGALHS